MIKTSEDWIRKYSTVNNFKDNGGEKKTKNKQQSNILLEKCWV